MPALKKEVCYLVSEVNDSTLWILERLARCVFATVHSVLVRDLPNRDLARAHLIFVRVSHPAWRWLVDYCNERRITYDYFIDDNFYEIRLATDPHNGPLFDRPETHNTVDDFIESAKRTIVMSRGLLHYLKSRLPKANIVYVTPPVDIELFDRYRLQDIRPVSRPFTVGCALNAREWLSSFIGEMVATTFARHGEAVRFEFLGWWPKQLSEHPCVKTFSAIWDYESYARFVKERSWDLGMAPLGETVFENCKTNNKFREYSAANLPALFSDVPLYRESVVHDHTGWLVPNAPEMWAEQISTLMADRALLNRVRMRARAEVENTYSQEVAAASLAAALS